MTAITIDNLTTAELNGTGAFDRLIQSVKTHLLEEYSEGRIRNAEYSTLYLGAISATIQQAIAFELSRQTSAKQADLLDKQIEKTDAEILGIVKQNELVDKQILRMDYEIEGIQKDLVLKDAQITQTGYQNQVLAKQLLKLDSEILLEQGKVTNMGFQNQLIEQQIEKLKADVDIALQQLEIAREQLVNMEVDRRKVEAEITLMGYQGEKLSLELANFQDVIDRMKAEKKKAEAEADKLLAEAAMITAKSAAYIANNTGAEEAKVIKKTAEKLDEDITHTKEEIKLYKQKLITEAAETMNSISATYDPGTRTSDTVVYSVGANGAVSTGGQMGMKIAVMNKQKESYDRDSEMKVAKVYTDLWSISKNADPNGVPVGPVFGEPSTKDLLLTDEELAAITDKDAAVRELEARHQNLIAVLDKLRSGIGIPVTP